MDAMWGDHEAGRVGSRACGGYGEAQRPVVASGGAGYAAHLRCYGAPFSGCGPIVAAVLRGDGRSRGRTSGSIHAVVDGGVGAR